MEFISTKGMTLETAPEGYVLVQYLEPFFGYWSIDFAIAYFDNPLDYEDEESGEGWTHLHTGNRINVISYCELPKETETDLTKLSQKEFIKKFGESHPNLGNVGE